MSKVTKTQLNKKEIISTLNSINRSISELQEDIKKSNNKTVIETYKEMIETYKGIKSFFEVSLKQAKKENDIKKGMII